MCLGAWTTSERPGSSWLWGRTKEAVEGRGKEEGAARLALGIIHHIPSRSR